jgi:hypothetical protein
MLSRKINTIPTSQDQPCYVWHHLKHNHAAGNGSITVPVKLPKTVHVDGFPVDYVVAVTASQPCATHEDGNHVSVSDRPALSPAS